MLAEEVEEERVVLEPKGPLDDCTDMDLPAAPAAATPPPWTDPPLLLAALLPPLGPLDILRGSTEVGSA